VTVQATVPAVWPEISARIATFRAARVADVYAAGERLGLAAFHGREADAREYALVHHYTYAISAAVHERRYDDADELVEHWRAAVAEPAVPLFADHDVAVVRADRCRRSDDDRYESPLYLHVNPGAALSGDGAAATRWREAGDMIEAAGLAHLVRAVTGIVVTLRDREHRETTNSYALKALPGTVFVDRVDDPVRIGELVLHESAHVLLNDGLTAFEVKLSPEARWFSPWKQAYRPAYGILHAGFAFGVLQRYFEFHGQGGGSSIYARVRAEIGARQWDEARDSVTQALAEVTDSRIGVLLRDFLC
jgi:hypothetical protein